MEAVWNEIKSAVKEKIPGHCYKMWIEPIEFDKTTEDGVYLSCPNQFYINKTAVFSFQNSNWEKANLCYNSPAMEILNEIRAKIQQGQFELSRHAVDRMLLRNILMPEIQQVIANGEMIEDYPNDKYGPSCLVLGLTLTQRPLHIQCSYPSRPLIKIITIYEPNPEKWVDFKKRSV